jgi:hypothetical protein
LDTTATLAPLFVFSGLVFGLISGAIWSNKGGNFLVGFLVGAILGVIGLVIVAVTTPDSAKARQLSSPPPPPPPPPTAAIPPSAIYFTHIGPRFALGYATSGGAYYGVWDLSAKGQPLYRMPYSDHGKAEALDVFAKLEPGGKALDRPTPADGF